MATIPRSWTSRLAALALLALAPAALAGPFGKRKAPEPELEVTSKAARPIPPMPSPLEQALPRDHGGVPPGLASASAQACNGCHYGTHDSWAASSHATGWQSAAFQAAVAEVGTPACTTCHLPLVDQQANLWAFDAGRADRPVLAPNPSWDATLSAEGVTCAACHLRDGVVVAATPPTPSRAAPHPVGWNPALGTSEACASCHQLTWPGADRPFYDTYGEWSRSPYAEAGVGCQDCHMGAGAAEVRLGADHGLTAAAGRGVSVLVDLPSPRIVRGASPVAGRLVLQNTGAGHSWPTGSPYRGVQVTAALEGPEDQRVELLAADLARTFEPEPPFATTADTRLHAGEERSWPLEVALDHAMPAGAWTLRIALVPTVRGEPGPEPLVQRAIPLRVE